ncbi:MAG: pilus assembly protein TadG-related protein [Anaerolineae bacterium]|jgi:hypothetical protein
MKQPRSEGQVLVWVAVLLVALLLFAGLAVDVGAGLSVRREMQNAADAGALAGAHELCFGVRGQATARALEYAEANGALGPVIVEIRDQNGNVDPTNGYVVWVQAGTEANTTLLGLLGVDQYPVNATAAAACGVATSSCGLWPLTFSEEVWNRNCDKVIYVWNAQNAQQEINCDLEDCDMDNDGIDDIVTGAGRGWVDFSDSQDPLYPDGCIQTGCGANEMSCLVTSGGSKDRVVLPSCLPGVGGVRASVVSDCIAQTGMEIKIPVFESMGCTAGKSCPNGGTYMISRFGCAIVEPPLADWEVTCDAGTYPCYNPTKHEVQMSQTKKSSVVRVTVSCDNCTTDCGGTAGDPPPPGGGSVLAVSLIE